MSLTLTDLFCGAGGSAQGAHVVPGIELRLAANHWQLAVDSHAENFPDADHLVADISQVDPRRVPRTDLLWASPECTNHSQAKGVKRYSQPDLFGETLPSRSGRSTGQRSMTRESTAPAFPLRGARPVRGLAGWKLEGNCVGRLDVDWTAEDVAGQEAAKAVCRGCPVIEQCLADALASGDAFAIAGGTTPQERRGLAPAAGFARPSVYGSAQHGTRGCYSAGCRRPECTAANTRYVAGWRRERAWSGPVTSGLRLVVLDRPAGRGAHRAFPGQLCFELPSPATTQQETA